jgi:hypothetical protein
VSVRLGESLRFNFGRNGSAGVEASDCETRAMQRLPSDVLADPAYRVPEPEPGETGMAWLRTHVVRFCEDQDHVRRRAQTQAAIDAIADAPFIASPTRSLLAAFGLSEELAADVPLASAAYQPHAPQSAEADAAADRLVAACGGRSEQAASRVCVLVQADAACTALAERIRAGATDPPLAATRRITPTGEQVEVDLADAHFGRGAHRCPGEALATRLATQEAQR